jgi:uncharacterized protein with ParB-like and HNH nuclease domain
MTVNSNFLENLKKLEVVQRPKCRKVKYLISEFGSGTIRIPEYQRSFVWDIPKQCRFIESIFLKVPVPAIFLMECSGDEIGNRNVFEVIDGVQRLTTLCNFFNGSLKLSGLQKLIAVLLFVRYTHNLLSCTSSCLAWCYSRPLKPLYRLK